MASTVPCGACATDNPAANRFCGSCGGELTAVAGDHARALAELDTAHGCFAPLGARPFLAAVAAARETLRLGGDAEAPAGPERRIDAEVLP